jgi:hypothetical protein
MAALAACHVIMDETWSQLPSTRHFHKFAVRGQVQQAVARSAVKVTMEVEVESPPGDPTQARLRWRTSRGRRSPTLLWKSHTKNSRKSIDPIPF